MQKTHTLRYDVIFLRDVALRSAAACQSRVRVVYQQQLERILKLFGPSRIFFLLLLLFFSIGFAFFVATLPASSGFTHIFQIFVRFFFRTGFLCENNHFSLPQDG